MAITQTGSVTSWVDGEISGTSTGTISGITVPADAEIMLIGVSAFHGTANVISANGVFDISGNTSVGVGGATSTSAWQCALHYILAPATGTQNLDWQWGATLTDSQVIASMSFWKGIDTGSPVRDSDGSNAGGDSESTPTLTAQTNDVIVAFGGTFDGSNGNLTFSFSPDTTLANITNRAYVDAAWGTAAPTGNQAMTWTATGADEGGIAAFVLKPAATGRTALNTRSNPLGVNVGMGWRMPF